ncbi:hypothetical protein H7T43_09245 [Peribacillus simplex]|uniref:hypothetical protein n=1 Tax=Peribacillus simplex TaxID=1478 RepID=UPI002989A319|nr:hypothetical protein [Peribacillus simplex]MBX9955100.1 hypothetical protein [Peribacillus simplex]
MGRDGLNFDQMRPVTIYWGDGQSVGYDSLKTLSTCTGISRKAIFEAIETDRHVYGWSFKVRFADGLPIHWITGKTEKKESSSGGLTSSPQPVVAIFPNGEEVAFPSKLAAGDALGVSYGLISKCIRENRVSTKCGVWFIDPSKPRPEPPAGFVFEKTEDRLPG